MADHPIQITVETTPGPDFGNFTYAPTHVRAKPGDTLTFSSPTGPFEVMFKHTVPGNHLHLHTGGTSPANGVDRTNVANRGVHKYAAAVFAAGRVFIDTGCGDVGVGD